MGIKKERILTLSFLLIFFVCCLISADICVSDKCKTKKGPGNDNPDENYSFATPISFDVLPSKTPDIIILRNGNFMEAGILAQKIKRDLAFLEPDQSPLEMGEQSKILVIPTGGLFGLENSEQFRAVLRNYVEKGGFLIVFAQQHGYEFSCLPTPDGKPITGYGWREDSI